MPDQHCDFLIIGAGMAGASAGYFLGAHGKVIVLERESAPGYHTTGRSAAFYAPSYGNDQVRPLTLASRPFFDAPPEGFTQVPLLHDRGALYVGRTDQQASLSRFFEALYAFTPNVTMLSAEDTLARCSALREDYIAGGIYEPDCFDMDVNALHQGFLRGIHRAGGRIHVNATISAINQVRDRVGSAWHITTPEGVISAPVLINAGGAWVDEIALMAGVTPLGFQPLRRTIVMLPAGPRFDASWPLVIDVDDDFYFKPESGQMLTSPGDETLSLPGDVQPEELDIAVTIDRIQAAEIPARRVESSWAGLRTFAPDRTPVVGFDPDAPGFFWFAGQGGYGIQTAPMMGQLAERLIISGAMPEALDEFDVSAATYAPDRFR